MQSNELGKKYVEWYHNCEVWGPVPPGSVARKRYCTMCALCNGEDGVDEVDNDDDVMCYDESWFHCTLVISAHDPQSCHLHILSGKTYMCSQRLFSTTWWSILMVWGATVLCKWHHQDHLGSNTMMLVATMGCAPFTYHLLPNIPFTYHPFLKVGNTFR